MQRKIIVPIFLLLPLVAFASDIIEGEVTPLEVEWQEASRDAAESEKERQRAVAEGLIPEGASLEEPPEVVESPEEIANREAEEDSKDDAWHRSRAISSQPSSFDMP